MVIGTVWNRLCEIEAKVNDDYLIIELPVQKTTTFPINLKEKY
jgi:hypothetical protein